MSEQPRPVGLAVDVGSFLSLVGILFVLLPAALVLAVVEAIVSGIQGSTAAYWRIVVIVFLTLLFGFGTIGVAGGYWIPRIAALQRHQGDWPNLAVIPAASIPVVGFTALLIDFRTAPTWLFVIGGVSFVLALSVWVDNFVALRRYKRKNRKVGRRG